MDAQQIKSMAFSGFIWKFSEKAGVQVLQIVIQIILARILMPEDYGLIGLLTIFIAVSDIFIQYGLSTGLIQKKEVSETDLSSVFYANMAIALSLYVFLYEFAPAISDFYSEEQLTIILRVLSLMLIIGASFTVHNAILSRNLQFRKSFFRNMFNLLTQGVVGVYMALNGFGVWSLVYSKLAGVTVGAIVMYVTVRWYPKWIFSFASIRSVFSFSSKLLITYLLNCLYNNIHTVIIGRFFTKSDLGYYQRGQQIPQASIAGIDGSLNDVLFSALSRVQDDKSLVKQGLRRSLKMSMFVSLPILIGLLAVADNLTIVLLTEKWSDSIGFMRLACIMCCFYPLSARSHALNAIGLSSITMKMNIFSKLLTVLFMFVCISYGIYALLYGTIIASCISFFIDSYFSKKYLGYSISELVNDLKDTFMSVLLLLLTLLYVNYLIDNVYLCLSIQIVVGIFVYVLMSHILKNESWTYLINLIKKRAV